MSAILGAIIPAVAAMAGAGINAATSIYGTKLHNESQRRESELAYLRQKEQIAAQNAYNSPSAQMARMMAAGLNPNLMYQQGQPGLQSDIARYEPAEMDNFSAPAEIGNLGNQMVQNLIGLKDIANKTALANADVLLKASTRAMNDADIKLKAADTKRVLALLGWEIDEKRVSVALKEAESALTNQKVLTEQENTELVRQKFNLASAEVSKMSAETREILARLPYAEQLAKMSVQERQQAILKAAAETALANARAKNDTSRTKAQWVSAIGNLALGAAGVVSNVVFKGASIGQTMGKDPWSMMTGNSKGLSSKPESPSYDDDSNLIELLESMYNSSYDD